MQKVFVFFIILHTLRSMPAMAQYSPGSQYSGLESAIKYFQQMNIKPNAHKREAMDFNYLMEIVKNIHQPEVERVVLQAMSNLAVDENCKNCDLFFAAQFSKNTILVNEGIRVFKKIILDGHFVINTRVKSGFESSVSEIDRYLFYFNRYSELYTQFGLQNETQDKQNQFIQAAANLLFFKDMYIENLQEELEKKWLAQHGPQQKLASAYFLRLYGAEEAKNIRNQLLYSPIQIATQRMEYHLMTGIQYDHWMSDIRYLDDEASHPLIISFLLKNFERITLHRDFFNNGRLYLSSIKSNNSELLSLVRRVLIKRIYRLDAGFNSLISEMRNQDRDMDDYRDSYYSDIERERDYDLKWVNIGFSVQDWRYLNNYFSNQLISYYKNKTNQKLYSNTEFLYRIIKRTIIRGDTNLATELAKLLIEAVPNFNLLLPQLQFDSHSNYPSLRLFAETIVKNKYGPNYLERVRSQVQESAFRAVERQIRDLPTKDNQQHQMPANFHLGTYIMEKIGRPELQKLLLENVIKIKESSHFQDYDILISSILVGPKNLQSLALSTLIDLYKYHENSNHITELNQLVIHFIHNLSQHYNNLKIDESKRNELVSITINNLLPLSLFRSNIEECIKSNCSIPMKFYHEVYLKAYGSESLLLISPHRTFSEGDQSNQWINDMLSEYQKSFLLSKSGVIGEYELQYNIRDAARMLIRSAGHPLVVKFLKTVISKATLYPDHWNYRVLWLAATASGDTSLLEKVRHVLRERIIGRDAKFNRTIGKNLKTTEDRFEFYLNEFMSVSMTMALENGSSLNELVHYLVLNLGLDLKYLRKKLESILLNSGNEAEYKIALKFFLDEFGKNQLPVVFSSSPKFQTTPNETRFVVVNGGYSEGSNYESNETLLKAFHYGLFQSQSIVLNAGGPEKGALALDGNLQPVVDGDSFMYRERMTLPALDESHDFPLRPKSSHLTSYVAATMANFKKTIQSISLEKPQKMTLVLGGHGSTAGFALWGKELLNQLTLNDLYREYFGEKLVRTIVSSCYAGSVLAAPSRIIPASLLSFDKSFVTNQYPLGKCGLATVNHFQLQYVTNIDWKADRWSLLFKQVSRPSLSGIRNILYPEGVNIPVLTSDYFLEDLRRSFCNEHSFVKKVLLKYNNDPQQLPKALKGRYDESIIASDHTVDWNNFAEKVCYDKEIQKVETFLKLGWSYAERSIEFSIKDRIWTYNLIKEQMPDMYTKAELYLQKYFPQVPMSWETIYFYPQAELMFRNGWQHSSYKGFYEKAVQEYIEANRDKFKDYLVWVKNFNEQGLYSFSSLEEWNRRQTDTLVNNNKVLYLKYVRSLPELLKPLLENSLFPNTKLIYNSLMQCESSALN